MTEERLSAVLATLALLALVLAALSVVALVLPAAGRQRDAIVRLAPGLSLLAVAIAVSGSLYYSEIADFVPCELCWFQRIAMYPLVVILLVAVLTDDELAYRYVLPISLIGAVVAAYHYQLQAFPDQPSTCSVGVHCTLRYVEQFGFVSIPFMAFSVFALVLTLQAHLLRDARRDR